MQCRKPWVVFGVVAMLTAGLTAWSYYYSPSLTVCDLTMEFDEGLLAVNVPLVPIAQGETPRTHFLLYRRSENVWKADKASRIPWRKLPKVEAFANDSLLVAGSGYWLGGWQSDARPGRFVVMLLPVWALATFVLLVYVALRAHFVRLRLWMFFVFTAIWSIGLLWLTRKARGDT